MALNNARLSAELQLKFIAGGAAPGLALTTLCDGIAQAVITEITTNANVLPTALLSAAPGAPVTGTGTIL